MTVARVSAEQRWATDVPPADAYAAAAEGLVAELAARLQGEVLFSDGDMPATRGGGRDGNSGS